jgi:hypothetical protein
MSLERASSSACVIDVLDHVLDKGIVIDAWALVSLAGINLFPIEARVVVASIETYRNHAGSCPTLQQTSVPSHRPSSALSSEDNAVQAPSSRTGQSRCAFWKIKKLRRSSA